MELLRQAFYELVAIRTADRGLALRYWEELEQQYSGAGRYYHTLDHLADMFRLFTAYKSMFRQPEAVLYALFYHDIVYDVQARDNERQSALMAAVRMRQVPVPGPVVQACCRHILATAGHMEHADPDTNLFTDMDLAVLGAPWPVYEQYYRNIRREYAIYPDLAYNSGRKEKLRLFLDMPRIFKTPAYRAQLEEQARRNIRKELQSL
jgi:predicted metal-dependent HD superfamily phosphohydrolase